MAGPSWLAGTFAVVVILAGVYSASRLAISLRRGRVTEPDADALHAVMGKVMIAGGETQIERVLTHAISETGKAKINALVFVGDAMEESLDRLCHLAGELGAQSVPLFVFHEGSDSIAETAFREMAQRSKGAYVTFSLSNIDKLKEPLAAIAVYATGGLTALADYGKQKVGEVLRLTSALRRG